jgi:hypothetical protein
MPQWHSLLLETYSNLVKTFPFMMIVQQSNYQNILGMNVPVGPPALLIPLYSHGELDVEEELQVNEETNLKQCIATKTIPVNKESNAINKSEEIVTTKQCTKTCSKPMNKFMIQCINVLNGPIMNAPISQLINFIC